MPPARRAGAADAWLAKAGKVVAAAEAAPRIRMKFLRETPLLRSEFIECSCDFEVRGIKMSVARGTGTLRLKDKGTHNEPDTSIPCSADVAVQYF
jgi:hypothetical protein